MAGSLVEEEIHRQVREQLNKEKVKLWLPPYTTEDVGKGEQPKVTQLILLTSDASKILD